MGDGSNHAEDEARWSRSMARAQEGDRAAYEQLVGELATAIESFVRRRFGGAGGSDFLEECVQESLIAIHRARHTYDVRRSFRAWLFTIVRHKAVDLLRRDRVRQDASREAPPPASGREDPTRRIDGAVLLERLEPKYREALILTKLDGYSLEEAATRAGVSVTAMKSRVHRALRAVQRGLGSEELP